MILEFKSNLSPNRLAMLMKENEDRLKVKPVTDSEVVKRYRHQICINKMKGYYK